MPRPLRLFVLIPLALAWGTAAGQDPSRDAVQRELQRRELQQQQTQQRIQQGVDVRGAGTPESRSREQLRLQQDLRLQQLGQRQKRELAEQERVDAHRPAGAAAADAERRRERQELEKLTRREMAPAAPPPGEPTR